MAETLQQQGVPIPSRLRGPQTRRRLAMTPQRERRVVQRRTPISGEMGGTQTETITTESRADTATRRQSRSLRSYSPTRVADKSTSGVGALEAEFLVCIVLLVALMFSNSGASYSDKMMSFIKRGTLTCVAFFILALFSSAGPNASRIAKAFGALIVVTILLTGSFFKTDASGEKSGLLIDLDNLIKNDWVATGEHGAADSTGTGSGSANTGTVTLTQSEISKLIGAAIGSPAYNSFTAEIRAFKSGDVWKLPVDAVNTLEQTGVHGITKLWGYITNLLGGIF